MYKIGFIVVIFMALIRGCDQRTSDQSETDSHAEEAEQLTLFAPDAEFYIEYEPLHQGGSSLFRVHVTRLATYRPYTEGTLHLTLDGEETRTDIQDQPGIFLLSVIPEREGAMELTCTLASGEHALSVSGQVEVLAAGSEEGEEDHDEHETGEVIYLKEQAWSSDFMVRELVPGPFFSVLTTSGEIMTIPGEKRNVAAPGRGMILFPDPELVQGSKVREGQLLFTIKAGTLEGDNFELRYQEYANRLNSSRSEFQRHRQLYENQVISERQFLESRTAYISDSIRFYNLAGKAGSDGLGVFAPAGGYVHHLNVSEGEFVETGQLLATLSSDRELMLRADVPQQHFQTLKRIMTANFRPAFTDRVYSIEELKGKLLARGSSVAENDHYIPLYFKVLNDGSLLEGAYAEFYLVTDQQKECLLVPNSAILEEQGNYYVYVQVTGESYSKRAVVTGESDGIHTEVISGLLPGERVVSRGGMLLKAASTVIAGDSGHGHSH